MRITVEHEPGSVLLRATGRLTVHGSARLHLALSKQLATGAAVLVDLSGLVLDRSAATRPSSPGRCAPRAAGRRPGWCCSGPPTTPPTSCGAAA